ncbi:hypothetical protein RI844_10930 [Thalassotalea fonticola]|uniref:Uncharacterized protein n=1 Tax=Thalassotalea fonticola TaxID=3065649 RepID=A0ABZ0GJ08_9GAMM|nr:hypothetical protein RI844_10930 [Colwelliaceae bacterium S1-1]
MALRNVSQVKVLLIVVIIFILMATFLSYFKKNEQDLYKTAMAAAAADITSKVLLIHSQWFMTGKPKSVEIKERLPGSDETFVLKAFKVNEFGWPDLILDHDACQRIWNRITGAEMKILNKPLFAVELNNKTKQKTRICRYQLNERMYIEYNSSNGKITNKN